MKSDDLFIWHICHIYHWKLEFSNITQKSKFILIFSPKVAVHQYSVRRLTFVTLVTPQNDDISLHALSTRPVIMSAAKRDRNSWHFYVIRARFQKSCSLIFTSLIRRLFTDFIYSFRYTDFFSSEFQDENYPLHSNRPVAVRGGFIHCRL